MSNGPKPGDKLVIGDAEYLAAPTSGACTGCVFDNGTIVGAQHCGNTPCGNIIWLTKLDYIKHRLTS